MCKNSDRESKSGLLPSRFLIQEICLCTLVHNNNDTKRKENEKKQELKRSRIINMKSKEKHVKHLFIK